MKKADITKVVITTADGREHTVEGSGRVEVILSYAEDHTYKGLWPGRRPSGSLEITMPLEAEWVSGKEGKYLVANNLSL